MLFTDNVEHIDLAAASRDTVLIEGPTEETPAAVKLHARAQKIKHALFENNNRALAL